MLELNVTGVYTQYDSRWLGGDQALAAPLLDPLQAIVDRFTQPALPDLRRGLQTLFAATPDPDAGTSASLDSIRAGTPFLDVNADIRRVPITLAYGATSRLTVGVTIPIERRGTTVAGPFLPGATVGFNPDTVRNLRVLEALGGGFSELGRARFLPLQGTPAARELQERLRTRAQGDTLSLPVAPLSFAGLRDGFRDRVVADDSVLLGIASARQPYHLGDVEIGARFQLFGAPGWPLPDTVSGVALRSTLGVRGRLPTGPRGNTAFLLELPPEGGHPGVGVDFANDLFFSRRAYLSATAHYDERFPADVRRLAFSQARPFPDTALVRTLRRDPGAVLHLTLSPRWRLTEEIAFLGEYAYTRVGETSFRDAEAGADPILLGPIETAGGWSAHHLGLGATYSTLPAYTAGRTDIPLQISLRYESVVAGDGGAPNAASIRVTGRLFYPLLGRARRGLE